MLDYVISQTAAFLDTIPKAKRKKIGQFFTPRKAAEYMASMFDLSGVGTSVAVLDPGSGTGILSAAFIERLQKETSVTSINLTCYETDSAVLPVLKNNLQYIKEQAQIDIGYRVIEDDYLLSQASDFNQDLFACKNPAKYDFVIGNPPYLRIQKNLAAAQALSKVVHGAPNLYFLFASMSLFNLKPDGEMVYIIPRSWTSGAYFKAFRAYLFQYGKLEQIHLFASRDKVFTQEEVLQETIILRVRKTDSTPETVKLTSSKSSNDFDSVVEINLPYCSVVGEDDELYVFLPTNEAEIEVIKNINRYSETLPAVGFRMKTGVVVDFRQQDDLRKEAGAHNLPLFYSEHIKNGRVFHQSGSREFDWITDSKPGLLQKNKNYVFCKRFTAKEERRRLQCGIYLASDFPEYKNIGTQNKINFVDRVNDETLTLNETYGLFALLNSTLFDMYYRILNGSTQVNSTEVNNIPVPSYDKICQIGKYLIAAGDLTTQTCDKILNEVAYG